MTTKTKTKPSENGKVEAPETKSLILLPQVAKKLSAAIDAKNQAARDYQISLNWEDELLSVIYEYENIEKAQVARVELKDEELKIYMK